MLRGGRDLEDGDRAFSQSSAPPPSSAKGRGKGRTVHSVPPSAAGAFVFVPSCAVLYRIYL